ncbi:11109_t:CDS:2 [Funneliformis caledonium]|uniref:11109_t:CDS:1 n=1 Tax=Funneliformis caledonium TaxID=1117310 RepID=A0A9N9IVK6_9GLOM|nr:11109_t:CDS:2 [Funneliformis caledonium]
MIPIKFSCAFLIISTVTLVTVVNAFKPQLVLQLVNDERSKVGAPALTLDGQLTQAAQTQTDYMVYSGNLTHENPIGDLGKRIRDTGYIFSDNNYAENVAVGYGTDEEVRVVQSWMSSSDQQNILNPAFTMGVAFGGETYWTQVFATPSEQTSVNVRPSIPTSVNFPTDGVTLPTSSAIFPTDSVILPTSVTSEPTSMFGRTHEQTGEIA